MGNYNAIIARELSDLAQGYPQILKLLLDGTHLSLADQCITAQSHQ